MRVSFLEEIIVWWKRQVTVVGNTDNNGYLLKNSAKQVTDDALR